MILAATLPAGFTELLALMLLHFLWQGASVALAVVVVGGLFRARSPQGRYALSLVALCAMIACPLVTFLSLDTGSTVAPPFGTEFVFPDRPDRD